MAAESIEERNARWKARAKDISERLGRIDLRMSDLSPEERAKIAAVFDALDETHRDMMGDGSRTSRRE